MASAISYIMENVSAEVPNVEWEAKVSEGRRVVLAKQPLSSLGTAILWDCGGVEISRFLIIPLSLLGRGTLE